MCAFHHLSLALSFLLLLFGFNGTAFSQQKTTQQMQSQTNDSKGKKTKKKQKPAANLDPFSSPNSPALADGDVPVQSPWFPAWNVPSFNFGLNPIAGAALKNDKLADGTTVSSSTAEVGLHAELESIPIIPGQPAMTTSPHVGYALGLHRESYKGAPLDRDPISGSFNRIWYGLDLTFFLACIRDSISVGRGEINYEGKKFPKLQNISLGNDFGVLILPYFSTHSTMSIVNLFKSKSSNPLYRKNDHWIHGRLFFDTLNFTFDFGPGISFDELYTEQPDSEQTTLVKEFQSSYLLAKTSSKLFWKLHMTGQAKYIISTDDLTAASNGFPQLPYQGVNEPQDASVLPDDSLSVHLFLGAHNIVGGLGGGYYYSYEASNYTESSNTERTSKTQHGYTVSFSMGF